VLAGVIARILKLGLHSCRQCAIAPVATEGVSDQLSEIFSPALLAYSLTVDFQ
jgi:hypothetical protein